MGRRKKGAQAVEDPLKPPAQNALEPDVDSASAQAENSSRSAQPRGSEEHNDVWHNDEK